MLRWIWVIVVCVNLQAQDQAVPVGEWRATGSLQEARERACAVRLEDGRVLISGGNGQNNFALSSAEVYSTDGKFQLTSPLNTPRAGHTCTLLGDGRVLVAGGDQDGRGMLELFDPATSKWIAAGEAGQALRGHTATLLPDGRVLILGDGVTLLFDPSNDVAVSMALTTARAEHVAVLLPSGAVMAIGGRHDGAALNTVDVIDPVAFTVVPGPSLIQRRAGHSANLLGDGRIVAIGGTDGQNDLDTAEILSLNDDAPTWRQVGHRLLVPRSGHIAVAVPGHGGVLLAGGSGNGKALASTEVFQSGDETFFEYKDLTASRSGIAAAMLDAGVILAMGGINESGVQQACGVTAVPTIEFDKSLYLSGDVITASASHFPARSIATVSLDLLLSSKTAVSIQNRLISPVNLRFTSSATESSLPATRIVQTTGTDAGNAIRMTVAAGPSGVSASATVPVKIRTSIAVVPGASVFAGEPATFNMALTRGENQGPMVGSLSVQYLNRSGGVLGSDSFLLTGVDANPFNRSFSFTFGQPQQITVKATYSGDNKYTTSSASVDYIFGEKQVDFSRRDLRFAPAAATWGTPVTLTATGTVFTGLQNPPLPGGLATFAINGAVIGQSPLTRAADGISFEASASYTPLSGASLETLALTYNGDSFYQPSVSVIRRFRVREAPTTLTFVNPPATYDCPGPTAFNVRLGFPATLGLSNRTVQLGVLTNGVFTALNGGAGTAITATLTPSASTPGEATATFLAPLASGLTNVAANFGGDLFLDGTTATSPVAMNKLATTIQFEGLATNLINPVTVKATVSTAGSCPVPGAQGTIQFFDGDLLVGAQRVTSGSATIVVSRPVGTRTLKAKYLGDDFRNLSETSRVVTFQ